jgi:hypothetical protein
MYATGMLKLFFTPKIGQGKIIIAILQLLSHAALWQCAVLVAWR